MGIQEEFIRLCKGLNKNPTKVLWEEFADMLKEAKVVHYSFSYRKGKVDTEQDLTTSKAHLFDSNGREVVSVPIFLRNGSTVRGALFYLRGLSRVEGGKSE